MTGRSSLARLEHRGLEIPRVHLRGPSGSLHNEDPDSRYTVGEEVRGTARSIVLRSHDTDLGREILMNVLPEDGGDSTDAILRFVEEARVTGGLQHPGVPPVYELGLLPDGRPFFTTKLLMGETLGESLATAGSSIANLRRLLGIFEQVCQTVAFAHSRDVAHGRLSAERVVVGPFGEVSVTGWGPGSAGDQSTDVRPIGEILSRILGDGKAGETDPELVEICRRCLDGEYANAEPIAADVSGYLAALDERAHRLEVQAIEKRAAAGRARKRSDTARAAAVALRRARRQTLAIAGAIVLALLVTGVAWWSSDAVRRDRAMRASRPVEAALRDAARRTGEGDLRGAADAAKRAHELALNDAVGGNLRLRTAAVLESADRALSQAVAEEEREQARRRLPVVLREIRTRRGIDPAETTAAAYTRAFREYGIDPERDSVDRVREDPLSDILVGALRDWGRLPDDSAARRLVDEIGDSKKAVTNAELQMRWWERPGDFEVNLDLAERLFTMSPRGSMVALRHLAVAMALFPDSAGLWVRVGDTCRRTGDGARATQAYRHAAELDPDWDVPHRRLE